MKICSKCGIKKPLDAFRSYKGGVWNPCRECINEKRRQYQEDKNIDINLSARTRYTNLCIEFDASISNIGCSKCGTSNKCRILDEHGADITRNIRGKCKPDFSYYSVVCLGCLKGDNRVLPLDGVVWYVTKDGYAWSSTTPRGRMSQHRYVMEDIIGRKLFSHETVHHINGDRLDNRRENLELWSTSQPSGQRIEDKIKWAIELLEQYGYKIDKT